MNNTYEQVVRKLASSRDPEIILNGSIDHAEILVVAMFDYHHGKPVANILSQTLASVFYTRPNVIQSIGKF